MKRYIPLFVMTMTILLPQISVAATKPPKPDTKEAPAKPTGEPDKVATGSDGKDERDTGDSAVTKTVKAPVDVVEGFGLGAGIGVNITAKEDIKRVSTADGTVRIEEGVKANRSIWLETHYLFGGSQPTSYICTGSQCDVVDATNQSLKLKQGETWRQWRKFYWGPFAAVSVGDGNGVINGAAFGGIISLRRNPTTTEIAAGQTAARYFNIGLAYSTQDIQVLGDGIHAGDKVTTGQAVPMRKRTIDGLLVLFSVGVY